FSRPEMPPVGAIFATARQRLLEALERSQAAAGRRASGNDPQPELEVEIPWPRRQRPGQYQIDSAAQSEPPFQQPASVQSQTSVQPAASAQAITRPARAVHRAGRAARLELPRIDVAGRARGAAAAVRAVLTHGRPRWNFLPPALVILLAVGLVLLGVHTVQTQQRQQLNQRFDSLISAAQQLEGQARTTADQAEAQSLIRRSQALVDQAAKLRHDQVPATTLRKALQADLDRLNKIDELPDPAILATFDGMDKHANAAELTGDSSALYVLGGGQGKVFQVMRVQKTVRAVLAKGQKVGQTEVATPVLLASRDGGGLLVLDSEHHLWQYEPSKGTVTTVGLQDAGTWKNAQDLGSYGQNLYVLDPTAGNILRYVPHGTQYSLPPSRFFEKDNQTALGGAVSMAIDGSIWLATSDGHILKLSGGQIQPFSVSGLPQPLSHAIAIFTTADTHSLYVLDSADRVVQLGKDGAYQRQLNLGLHGTATSLWVDELNRNLYVLAGNKLYAYQLPL
ncbi:MAG: hypothetical protein KGJ86_15000, partial [Chloroflexota bacterium]|nr:hypothetical protein [Chloroflexota bacterium]